MTSARKTVAPRNRAPSSRSRAAAVDTFREWLGREGLKYTQERAEIVEAFFELENHVEAEEFLRQVRDGGSRVSRATIYRTLDLLVQAGLARRVRLGTDHYHYEHILGRGQHEHMICVSCDRVIEWYDPELEWLILANLERHRFTAERYSLQVFGRCSECVEADAAERE